MRDSARGRGRWSTAWGGARKRGTPATSDLPCQPAKRATAINQISLPMRRITNNCRPFHGLDGIYYPTLLGLRAVALHPRLYSGACSAGWAYRRALQANILVETRP